MYAIIATGGKQYKVSEGDIIKVEKLDAEVRNAVLKAEKALGDTGRVLLRKSGTEPVVRVMAEAPTKEECEKHCDDIIAAMKDAARNAVLIFL